MSCFSCVAIFGCMAVAHAVEKALNRIGEERAIHGFCADEVNERGDEVPVDELLQLRGNLRLHGRSFRLHLRYRVSKRLSPSLERSNELRHLDAVPELIGTLKPSPVGVAHSWRVALVDC